MRRLPCLLAVLLSAPLLPCRAAEGQSFVDMSIEQLSNIRVTSVSRKPERLAQAAASVFVITQDDIRRSGARTLAEALRLAPNLQVAAASESAYAISARGMNGSLNSVPNKLLVLIDGRSVYSPLFSGVFWDAQDVVLEDVDRIEVISGPGGTLWGVNAVNGIINVITRSARDTAGQLAALSGGSRGADGALRYGSGVWRVYAKYLERGHTKLASGAPVADARHQAMAGMRADWDHGADQFTVEGNVKHGIGEQPKPGTLTTGANIALGDITNGGANLTGQWTRHLDDGAVLALQGYVDHTRREVVPTFAESLDIADLQLKHDLAPWGRHALTWGGELRATHDRVTNSATVAFLPPDAHQRWSSLYAQDVAALTDTLSATLGARWEHNDYTGGEWLPNLRLAWQASPAQLLWAAASRTVRAPSRLDVDTFVPGAPPYLLRGGPAVLSEAVRVFELGYRGQPTQDLSFSATLFHNQYDHLRTQEVNLAGRYVYFASKMDGESTGLEVWSTAQLMPAWRVAAGATALRERFHAAPDSVDKASPLTSGKDPAYSAQLRSTWAVGADMEFELGVRRVARLVNYDLPAYTAVDARLLWTLGKDTALSIAGQNLNGDHAEYGPAATRSMIPRALAVNLTWRR